jgi:plasmid stabilization system protein ParE
MRIDYTERALSDLAAIHDYLAREWPGVGEKFEARLTEIEHRILTFPRGSAAVEDRPGVFAVPFINFPYRVFYTMDNDTAVVVLHIRNTSRAEWAD